MLDKDLQAWIIGKPKNRDTVLSASAFLPVVELASVRVPAPEIVPVVKESSFDDQNPIFIEEVLEAEEIPISELPRTIPKIERIQPEPRDEAVTEEPVMARETPDIEEAERNSRVAQLTEQFRQNQRTVSYQSGLRKKRLSIFLLLLLLLLGLLGAWGVSAWNKARNVVVQPPEPEPAPVSQDIAPPEPEPEPVSDDVVSDEVVSSEVIAPVEIVILPPPPPEPEPEPPKPVVQKKSKPVVRHQPAKKSSAPAKKSPTKPAPAKKAPPSDNGIVIPGTPPRAPRIFRPPRGGLLRSPF